MSRFLQALRALNARKRRPRAGRGQARQFSSRRLQFETLEERQLLTAATPLSPEFQVNTFTTSYQVGARVASDAAGDYVVVWESYGEDGSYYGVFGQRYNNFGAAQGSEFQVNTYTVSDQARPTVAMDSAGDFVVAWNSLGQDGSGYGIYAQRYASTGSAQGSEFQVNTYTTGYQWFPSVAMDSAGDFVVAWESYGQDGSGYGIYAQRYASTGSALGSEFQVNTYTTGPQTSPSVAMDSAGDFVITWQSDDQDGNGYGVYAQRYASTGSALGSEFRVNTYTTHYQWSPSVAMDSAGDFVVAWASYSQDGSSYGIYAQRYASTGSALGSEFRVNTYTTNAQESPSVAMDSAGDFIVAWQSFGQDGSIHGVYAQRYASTGSAQGSEFQVNTYTTSAQNFPSVAMDSTGDFVIAWQSAGQDGSSYGIYARQYLLRVNTYATGNQRFPKVASDAAGDYVVVWESYGQDGSDYGIYAQRYASTGSALGSEFRVNVYTTGNQEKPVVAMDSAGDFVVAWQSYQDGGTGIIGHYGIYAQVYNNSGTVTLTEFQVNAYTTGAQAAPSVAMDSAGDFVIAWQSFGQDGNNYGVYAQRYNLGGSITQTVFQVNAYTTGSQEQPSVAMDAEGDFVIAWESNNQDGSGDDIYARQYNSSGATVRSEFQVNTYTTSNQTFPSVAMDATGDFVVAWQSLAQDGSDYGIYAQHYVSSGGSGSAVVAQGSEFQVNTDAANFQVSPSVAMDSSGDFVVTWQSYAEDGSAYGVYAQKYRSNGATSASEFQVNTYTTGDQESPAVAMDSAGDFVVAWESYGQDGSGYGVYAQRYSSSFTSLPLVTTTASALSYTAGSGAQAIDPGVTLTDTEVSNVTGGATISISSGYVSGEDTLAFVTQGNISGSFVAGTGTLTLSGTATVAQYQAALEAVTYTDTKNDATTTARTISFTVNDGTNVSNTATRIVNPLADVATHLAFTGQPPSSVTAGAGFSLTVKAEDSSNNVITGLAGTVTLALGTNPGGSSLGGTTTVTLASGVATFSGLTLNKAGAGYRLAATDGSLTAATSSAISVAPGTATHLLITAQPPTTVTAGSAFGLTVTAEDAEGNVATGFAGNVTIAIAANPGSSTLGGTTSVAASGGVAVFSGLTLNKVGAGYTLVATDSTLTAATSNAISVAPGTATQLLITAEPPSTVTVGSAFGLTVTAEDAEGNLATGFFGNVTVAIATNPGSGTLGGTTSVAASGGVAVFSGLTLNSAGTGYVLQLTSSGLTSANTSAVNVTASGALTIDGTATTNMISITFTDATHFTITGNGPTTNYTTTTTPKVTYNGPSGVFSQVIVNDPFNSYTATQNFASTDIVAPGFEFVANLVQYLYVYVNSASNSTATVTVGTGTGNNYFVGAYSGGYSYIADPIKLLYSELSGFGQENVTGSGSSTYAYIYSTSHGAAVGIPGGTSTYTLNGKTSNLASFPQVYVVGAADGTDTVNLHSAGGTFVGTPNFDYVGGTISGASFLIGAVYAANVTATSAGTTDTAVIYSYAHNTFNGAPGSSSLSGSTTNLVTAAVSFLVTAVSYTNLSVFESGAGTDVANLTSPGHSSFFGTSTASIFTVGTSTITVDTYFTPSGGQPTAVPNVIVVTGNNDSTDQATLNDSTGSNALVVGGSQAALTTAVGSVTINKFGSVTANKQNGSSDSVHMNSAIDYVLTDAGWTSV